MRELWAVLLELAGSWFVLAPAMEELAQLERIAPSANGEVWATRAAAIIERRRSANRTFCQVGG